MKSNDYIFLNAVTDKNFNINPTFIKITGSITYGYFFTQLMFLFRAYKYQEFYKSDKYMQEHYMLTEWELRQGRKVLIDLGLIKTRLGQGKKLYYQIEIEKLGKLYESAISITEETTVMNSIAEETSDRCRGNHGTIAEETTAMYKEDNDLEIIIKNNDNEVVVNEIGDLEKKMIKKLNGFGLKSDIAWQGIQKYGLQKVEQYIYYSGSPNVRNRASWLTSAFQLNYKLPSDVEISSKQSCHVEANEIVAKIEAHAKKLEEQKKSGPSKGYMDFQRKFKK